MLFLKNLLAPDWNLEPVTSQHVAVLRAPSRRGDMHTPSQRHMSLSELPKAEACLYRVPGWGWGSWGSMLSGHKVWKHWEDSYLDFLDVNLLEASLKKACSCLTISQSSLLCCHMSLCHHGNPHCSCWSGDSLGWFPGGMVPPLRSHTYWFHSPHSQWHIRHGDHL